LIYFVLASARGRLRPVAIALVGFVCLRNAVAFEPHPEFRGADFWPSQIRLSHYFPVTKVLAHPFWANEEISYEIQNASLQVPPVLKRLDEISDVELAGLSAKASPEGWTVTVGPSSHDTGKNLLSGEWGTSHMTLSDRGDGSFEANISATDAVLYQRIPSIEPGRILTFSFEARSDRGIEIRPAVSDEVAGRSFTAALTSEWQRFVFELKVAPASTGGGVFVVLGSGSTGSFQVRNLKATLDPSVDRYVRIDIPEECRSLGNIALNYTASSAEGYQKLDRISDNTAVDRWKTQYRSVGPAPRNVMFAMPSSGYQWLKLAGNWPMNIRNVELRCY
jgi:hypothetical protein